MKAAATKQQAIAPGYEAMATCWNLESGIDLKGLSFKEMTVDEETGIVFATTKRTNFVEEIFLGGGAGAEQGGLLVKLEGTQYPATTRVDEGDELELPCVMVESRASLSTVNVDSDDEL